MKNEKLKVEDKKFSSYLEFAIYCYEFLIKKVDYSEQSNFIATYVYRGESKKKNNPNLDKMIELSENIYSCMLNHTNVKKGVEEIGLLCEKIELEKYEDDQYNVITFMFFIINAIDQYYKKCKGAMAYAMQYIQKDQWETYIFKKGTDNLFLDKNPTLAKKYFNDGISERFEMFFFVNKNYFPRKCDLKITDIVPDMRKRPSVWDKTDCMKIGVIPYTKDNITKIEQIKGASYHVVYPDNYYDENLNRAIRLLEESIEQGCNIVVFPEYVINTKMQYKIGEYLKEKYNKDHNSVNKLMMVIAGSAWENDTNISRLFDYKGSFLGQYNKYSPYFVKDAAEALQNKGAFCTLVDLPGVGRILPAICRDVVNDEYTRGLVKLFRPFAVFIPAWSHSMLQAFNSQLISLAMNYYASSFLCNCCEALNSKEDETEKFREFCGMAVLPKNLNSDSSGFLVKEFLRKKEKCEVCNKGGCIYVLTINYANGSQEINQTYIS